MRKKYLLTGLSITLSNVMLMLCQNNAVVLNGAYIVLNGGTAVSPIYFVVNQPNTLGIVRTSGHIHSENQYNYVEWITGTNTGSYVIPFGVGGTATDYIPFAFNKTNAASITLTVSTYSTIPANTPMPGASTSNGGAVAAVSSIPQAANAIDRYWDVKTNAAVNADLTFSYRGSIENTISGSGYCQTDTIKAQNWNGGAWNPLKGPGNPGVTSGIGVVGPIPFTTYGQFVLASVPISPTVTPTNATLTCTSPNTTATVLTTGGLGPYTYSWSTGATSSVVTISNPGSITATVTGANGCNKTVTVTVTQNTVAPSITTAASGSLNCTTTTVQITSTVTPSSGISYNWSGPGIVSGAGTGTITVNQGGTYSVTITNTANGCTTTATQAVTQSTNAVTVSATSTGSLNCITNTVQITTTVNPSSGISYNWSGPGIVSGAGTGTITVNQGGTYNVTVTNTANGCTATVSQAITQNTTAPTISAAPSGSLNCTTSTVQITTTVTPSSGITYNWSGPGIVSGAGTGTITVNQGGTYNLTVTNTANNCTATTSQAISQNTTAPIVTSGSNPTITCSSSSVNISATSNPNTNITVNWTGGVCGPVNSLTTQACSPGNYVVQVTDNTNGCVGNATVTVFSDSNVPNVTTSNGTITCSNPTTQVVATTTSSPVNYTWTGPGIVGPSNTATIAVNQGGTYTLVVTNTSNGCSSTITTSVPTDTNTPSITLSNNTATLSCSVTTVQIDATASPSGTFSWTTTGGSIVGPSNTPTLNASSAGVYSVYVTGTNGCISVATATVYGNSNAPIVTLSANSATITCSNSSVSINATVPGTVSSASYSWTPSSGISSGANSSTATFTAGGTYSLVVTDNSNGCSTTTVVNITSDQNPPSVSITASNPSITCTNGTVDISVNPVNPSDTYLWNGAGSFTGQGTATITTTVSGTYSVVVTNTVNGCSTTQTTSIGFNNNLVLSVTGNTNVCQGSNIVLNGSGANTYTWTDGTNTYTTSGINIPASSNITFTLVGTLGSCNSTTIIGVNVSPSINVVVSASPNTSISIGESVTLNASGAASTSYTWIPSTGLNNPNIPNPQASPVNTTTYCVIGTDVSGVCSDSACIKIYVDTRCPELFVPNVFSPNNDGVNDKLEVYGTKCVKEFHMVIFDRWGEKVFETTDPNEKWDGNYKGKDMNNATFVYYIKGLYKDDKPIDLKGNFTIVK